jgi:hypothetical protein
VVDREREIRTTHFYSIAMARKGRYWCKISQDSIQFWRDEG